MKKARKIKIGCVLALCCLVVVGCGKKADESKPISEVKAEAQGMSVDGLRDMALKYKDAILAKEGEINPIMVQLKKIPITQALGDEAKGLKAELGDLTKSIEALKERFEIYYDELKEKGGDTSGL